jgi:hypothetical protein
MKVLFEHFFVRKWDFKFGGFLKSDTQKTIVSKRLLFDSLSNLYEKFKTENLEYQVSKSSFVNVKKALGCCRAKGIIDGCNICLPEKYPLTEAELFVRDQHTALVRKSCRAIRTIRDFLPHGLKVVSLFFHFS